MDDQPKSLPSSSGAPEPSGPVQPVPAPTADTASAEAAPGVASSPSTGSQDLLLDAVRELRERFDSQIARNDLHRKAFDALHAELQAYKGSFVLDELHKPVIGNLVRLYDSFLRLEQLLPAAGPRHHGSSVDEFVARLGDFVRNMENFRLELTEVLARLDVETYEDRHDALAREAMSSLDRKLHRPVAVEPTEDPARHNAVVRTHKPGFYWRDRVFRPEEVTILRHEPAVGIDGGDDG